MNGIYLLNRFKILCVIIVVSLGLDYLQGDHIDLIHIVTKVATMIIIVGVLSFIEYLWKRRGNA